MPLPPPLPEPGTELAIAGFTLGHGTDRERLTGVTVILCPEGMTAAAEVRGTATGTRQFDSLTKANHLASRAHAVVLAGGSSFGLAAADPVAKHLVALGAGFETGAGVVPVVPSAILFDLAFGPPGGRPGPELARAAVQSAAAGEVACGSVGAGTGATVGKAMGLDCAMKGGFGFAALTPPAGSPEGPGPGLAVAAAVAVNAFGDVRDPETGAVVAGCRAAPDSHRLVRADRVLAVRERLDHPWEGNTTLAVVMTDAGLTKLEVRKVCEMAFGGLYRSLLPALSLYDGDLVVGLAAGRRPAHVHQVGVLAERAVAAAIQRAVREADGFGILPAVRDLRPDDEPG